MKRRLDQLIASDWQRLLRQANNLRARRRALSQSAIARINEAVATFESRPAPTTPEQLRFAVRAYVRLMARVKQIMHDDQPPMPSHW